MLNKAKPKRLKCKGNLGGSIINDSIWNNTIKNGKLSLSSKLSLNTGVTGFGKALAKEVPVLSIFAFLGILGYTIGLHYLIEEMAHSLSGGLLFSDITNDNNKAYAAETDTSASLIVDDGVINDKVDAAYNNFAYASHKVTVEASNIKSYTLTLTRNKDLTGPSTITGAAGKTPAQMTGTSSYFGYAWINDGADPTAATYNTLNATQNLTNNPAINSTTHSVSGSKQLVFGAKFGDNATSGTYSAKATLSMVATPYTVVNYSITYNTNGGSVIANTAATDDTGATSKTLTISNITPTLTGYKFAGWTTTTNGSATYQPGNNITVQASNPNITLYAVWKQDVPTIKTITNMQQMTAAICNASTVGDTNTLTDTRDNATYVVKKLNDSQCWMTQNLRIINKGISSTDSDMASGSFTIPASSTSGFSSDTVSNAYYGNDATKGAYYSWCAATAGTCSSATSDGKNAPSSICPKGWHLPVSGSGTTSTNTGVVGDKKNDFMVMLDKTSTSSYTDASLVSGTNITLGGVTWPLAGFYNDSSFDLGGARGDYWSRTASSSIRAYGLAANNGGYVNPADANSRHGGVSVRCVAYSN